MPKSLLKVKTKPSTTFFLSEYGETDYGAPSTASPTSAPEEEGDGNGNDENGSSKPKDEYNYDDDWGR